MYKKYRLLVFLALSLLPICTYTACQLYRPLDTAKWQIYLAKIRDTRSLSITQFYQTAAIEACQIASDPKTISLRNELLAFGQAHNISPSGEFVVDGDEYDALYGNAKFMQDYCDKFDVYDIFLIDADTGQILYTVAREPDLGLNLTTGELKGSSLAECWSSVVEKGTPYLTDTEAYVYSNGCPAQFIGAPLYCNDELSCVVVLQLPYDKIDDILHDPAGLGETGDAILIGQDSVLRSNSRKEEDVILTAEALQKPVQQGLNGETGFSSEAININGEPCLTAYGYIDLPASTQRWAIIVEVLKSEVSNHDPPQVTINQQGANSS